MVFGKAWKQVQGCIVSLEERGNWIKKGEKTKSAEGEDDRKTDNDLRLSAKLTTKKIMVESREENQEEIKLVLPGGKEHEVRKMEKEWRKDEDLIGKEEGVVSSSLKKNGLGMKQQGLGTFINMKNDICTTGVKTRIRDYERMLTTGVSLKGEEDMRFERELQKIITC